jgi:hypothetical protein
MKRRFPRDILAAIHDGKILGTRAGTEPHRFIGIWAVVVQGRVVVRSSRLKPRSWYRTFLKEPRGTIPSSRESHCQRFFDRVTSNAGS